VAGLDQIGWAVNELLTIIDQSLEAVGILDDGCKFRAAMHETMGVPSRVNQYMEEASLWLKVKTNQESVARSPYVAIQAISSLKVFLLWCCLSRVNACMK
jgi:methionyl-tRNA synthetase